MILIFFLYRYGVVFNECIYVLKGCYLVVDGCQIVLILDIDNVMDCYSIGLYVVVCWCDEMMRGMVR